MTTGTLLAIKPGSREIGCAVFIGDALTDQAVKSLRRVRPPQERLQVLHRVMTKLIESHKPAALAIDWATREKREALTRVHHVIVSVARHHDLPAFTFDPTVICKNVTGDPAATKRIVARTVCEQYPHLRIHLNQKFEWRERYLFNLFDAVACGMTYHAAARTNSLSHHAA